MFNNYSTFRNQCHCGDLDKGYIYHNPKLGLISLSSNGFVWITITDKNLGATEVWKPGDALTQQNVGYFYQRGNCHPRPMQNTPASRVTQVKANAAGYGPGKPRYNDIFIINSRNASNYRDSSDNFNIWGGGGDELEYMYDNGNDRKLRQFMCDDGFHIPSGGELIKLLQELVRIDNILNDSGLTMERKDDFTPSVKKAIYELNQTFDGGKYILVPKAGGIDGKNANHTPGAISLFSSSSMHTEWNGHYNDSIRLIMGGRYSGIYSTFKCSGCNIRPFKNEPVVPDDTWIKLY